MVPSKFSLKLFLDDVLLRSSFKDITLDPLELCLRWNSSKLKFFLQCPVVITYYDEALGQHVYLTVPQGQRSNGESIPDLLLPFFPPYGGLLEASVIHDGLRSDPSVPQRVADHVMLGILKQAGYCPVRRALVFWAIRLGGWLRIQLGFRKQ